MHQNNEADKEEKVEEDVVMDSDEEDKADREVDVLMWLIMCILTMATTRPSVGSATADTTRSSLVGGATDLDETTGPGWCQDRYHGGCNMTGPGHNT